MDIRVVIAPALVWVLFCLWSTTDAKLPLPSYIPPCDLTKTREEQQQCTVKSARKTLAAILEGDRKYKVPSLNPLLIDQLQIDDGHGPLGLALDVKYAKVRGFDRVRVDKVDINMDARHVIYNVYLPNLEILSTYNISGRILLLPITGYGDANLTVKDAFITYEYDFELVKKEDGETYFIPKPYSNFRFNTSRLYIHFDNLFNGDKLLGDNTNKFLDENWEEMMMSLEPIFSTTISEIIHKILTNIFELVPLKNAFIGAERYLL